MRIGQILSLSCLLGLLSGLGSAAAHPLSPFADKLMEACGRKISMGIFSEDFRMNLPPRETGPSDELLVRFMGAFAEDMVRLCKADPAIASRVSLIEYRSMAFLPAGERSQETIYASRRVQGWRYIAAGKAYLYTEHGGTCVIGLDKSTLRYCCERPGPDPHDGNEFDLRAVPGLGAGTGIAVDNSGGRGVRGNGCAVHDGTELCAKGSLSLDEAIEAGTCDQSKDLSVAARCTQRQKDIAALSIRDCGFVEQFKKWREASSRHTYVPSALFASALQRLDKCNDFDSQLLLIESRYGDDATSWHLELDPIHVKIDQTGLRASMAFCAHGRARATGTNEHTFVRLCASVAGGSLDRYKWKSVGADSAALKKWQAAMREADRQRALRDAAENRARNERTRGLPAGTTFCRNLHGSAWQRCLVECRRNETCK